MGHFLSLSRNRWIRISLAGVFVVSLVASLLAPQFNVSAVPILSITPLTWNVVGLDSNDVTSGPENFPVGARVCNTGADPALNVTSSFVWDPADPSPSPYINTRPGSLTSFVGPDAVASLAAGTCHDFYYEVQVTRNAAAYNTHRRYYITAAADTLSTIRTPRPREIFVEHLISQNRNSVTDVRLNDVPVAAGGTMSLVVGNTYNIQLVGNTATQGYEQIESFINFPNTIFKVNTVSTTYTANTGSDGQALTKPYSDACQWVNDPTSPNYRSCVGAGKSGGSITVTYNVTVIGGAGTNQTLNTLIYDFSGSSYHYNSDWASSARIASIIDPGSVTISKAFTPSSTTAGGNSTLVFTITNPTGATISGVNFTDTLPSPLVVATPSVKSTSGCGSATVTALAATNSISFSNGTLAPNGTCTVSVSVNVPAGTLAATYHNTSNNVFVDTLDTGDNSTADLIVGAATTGTGICGQTLAQWNFDPATGTGVPPLYTSKAANVTTATASYTAGTTGGAQSIDTAEGSPDINSWAGSGFQKDTIYTASTAPYFGLTIDTNQYTNVAITLRSYASANWGTTNVLRVWSSANGGSSFTSTTPATGSLVKTTWSANQTFAAASTGASTTIFRINADGANPNGATMNLDTITITGCGTPVPPTLAKSFSLNPVLVGGTSILTFTITNSGSATLHGLGFTDTLPAGLTVATSGPTSICSGTLSTTSPSTITFSGGSLAGPGTCNIPVTVTATTAGPHTNISGFISSTEGGTNTGAGGSATASLTALQPPTISKTFNPNPILAGGVSTLTFLITNPNTDNSLPAVAFTDTFPTSPGAMVVANPPVATTTGCGSSSSYSPAVGAGSISFSGGTIAAGASCTVKVNVTAPAVGDYANTSSAVTTTISGVTTGTDQASDTLTVNAPHPSISLSKKLSTSNTGPWSSFLTLDPTNLDTDSVFYQFTIENTGDVPLTLASASTVISDATVSTASCTWYNPQPNGDPPVALSFPNAILPAASATQDPSATCVVGPIGSELGDHPNTATARASYGGSPYTSDPSSAEYVGVTTGSLGLSLIKQVSTSASGPWASAISGLVLGDPVYYKFTVINSGAVDLDTITVEDPALVTQAASCNFTELLAAGSATTCVTTSIAALDGTHSNTATAHALDSSETPAVPVDSGPSTATYTASASPADLTVSKTNENSGIATVNTAFTWTVTVSNIGAGAAAFADGQTIVSDPLPAGATYDNLVLDTSGLSDVISQGNLLCEPSSGTLRCRATGGPVTIGAGEGFSISFDATPTASGNLSNTATVDPLHAITESSESNNVDTDAVDVSASGPELAVEKSSTTTSITAPGVVNYSYLVTNTGNVILTNISAIDDNVDIAGVDCPFDTLAAGTNMTCTATHTVTQAEVDAGGNLSNLVTVTSNAPDVTDTLDIPITAGPIVTVEKSSLTTSITAPGEVTYSYLVTNTGNVTLTSILLTDDNIDSDSMDCPFDTLAVGTNMTCTATHLVTQAEIDAGGILTNHVTVTSNAPVATDTLDIPITSTPALTVEKSSLTSAVSAPGIVTYSYLVTNTSNVTLTDISAVDDNVDVDGVTCPAPTLNVGAFMTCTATHTVTQAEVDAGGNLTNHVTVSSNAPDATDTLIIPITSGPAVTVEKSSTTTTINATGVVNYSYFVTNTGNVTLTSILVTDDNIDTGSMDCPFDSLAVGANMTCTATHTVTQAEVDAGGTLSNLVTVTSNAPDATDTLDIPFSSGPAATVEKSSTTSSISVPGVVTYSYTVTNIGNVTLTGILVTDDNIDTGSMSCPSATLDVGEDMTCTATHTVTQAEVDAGGNLSNLVTVTSNAPDATDTLDIPIEATASLSVTKDLASVTFNQGDPTTMTLTYTIVVENTGDVDLSGLQVTDDLAAAFPSPATYTLTGGGPNSSDFTLNSNYDGSTDTNLLDGTDDLTPGNSGTITLVVHVTTHGGDASYTNVAEASGNPLTGDPATDSDDATGPSFIDPALTKSADPSQAVVGDTVTFTITVTNNGTVAATNVVVTDTLPGNLDYVSANSAPSFPIAPPPPSVVVTIPTLNPGDVVIITIVTRVNALGQPPVQNTASLTADPPPDGVSPDPTSNNTFSATFIHGGSGGGDDGEREGRNNLLAAQLPSTGFAPGITTVLPAQPASTVYQAQNEVRLEIPKLHINMPVVGVPFANDTWDVTWLSNQAGWLQGTAFPSWSGNSLLTGHVYLANGLPGPFIDLHTLGWGDQVIVHVGGQRYIYEVRSDSVVLPNDTSILRHEAEPWLTLLTCKDYNAAANTYDHRVAVRAVLIKVEAESTSSNRAR